MENFQSIDEVLNFAIQSEQEAIDFYSELANFASNSETKKIFLEFVEEEMQHKSKLLKIKHEGIYEVEEKKVMDLKISDYLIPVKANSDMSYEDALVVVMRKEKAAFKLYSKLAERAPNDSLRKIFTLLAQEEANHKLHFETEYDEQVLKNN